MSTPPVILQEVPSVRSHMYPSNDSERHILMLSVSSVNRLFSSHLYWSARSAVTSDHKVGSIKQQTFPLSVWRLRDHLSQLCPRSQWYLAISGVPWLGEAPPQSLSPCTHSVFPVCMSVQISCL